MHCFKSAVFGALLTSVVATGNQTVFINPELTYHLPPTYSGSLLGGFVDTNTTNAAENALLATAEGAVFVAYDEEFMTIIGSNPKLELVAESDTPFAGEAGVWVSDKNEVWFTSNT